MNKIRCSELLALALSCAIGITMASPAVAGPIGVSDVEISVSGSNGTWGWDYNPIAQLDDKGDFRLEVPQWGEATSPFVTTNISVEGNVDPVISANFTVLNNTAMVQDYSFIFTLPIIAQTPFTLTGGSTGITVTDVTGDGAIVGPHTNGRPTYYAQIDGVDFAPMTLTPIIEVNPFESETSSDAFGTPIPSLGGPPALSTIGIRYDFSLTPGDTAAVTGVFVVVASSDNPIPEPASITLVALAGLMVAGLRRKLA